MGEQINASASDGQSRRGVTCQFEVADAAAQVERLRRIFGNHDLSVEGVKAVQGFRTSGPGYRIVVSILDEHLRVNVGLVDSTPDEHADHVLRPVIDALAPDG